ncbi:TPA: hypothetical protein HA265_01830 [Candidatus Woesearchaeota archaeon]|nr:hypothetical protein [Candidatus Woesearchaeota archaeon]
MKSKKAQVAGQIFIYIIAIVVVGLIIAYGYSAIKSFSQKGEEVEYINLRTSIENSVKAIASDYGSIKRPDFDIPGKYEMVCFVEKGLSAATIDSAAICDRNAAATLMPGEADKFFQPIVCSAWKTGRDDVFLIPDGSESFNLDTTIVISETEPSASHHFLCLDVVNNKIKLQLKALGDRVEISSYE